jgi:type IV pilus assembly protein PilB
METLQHGQRIASQDALTATPHEATVVHYLQQTWETAARLRASDIHFEPFENFYRVRLRIDGILQEITPPPLAFKEQIASRIKVLSRLDIAEKRMPQDGRMHVGLHNSERLHLRVSTLPTLFGEKMVVRILASDLTQLNLDHLGYSATEKQKLLHAIQKPHGMILVTGPTGSGKSQSLYACLQRMNKTAVNISSVEDPSEIHLPGVNQVNVKEKIGLTFATALRAFLRQDPDVLMVGEIRDHETADIAIKASQTGHLVLSTLHTQDAPSALVRLRNMGVATYNLAASISLISAQRLVRRLCLHCRIPTSFSPSFLKELGLNSPTELVTTSATFYLAKGCAHCYQGYWGRIGLFQVMPVSVALQQLILQEASIAALSAQAALEGVSTLRHAGLVQAALGVTSVAEVLAHTDVN